MLLRSADAWRQLGVVALEMLDVEMAIAGAHCRALVRAAGPT